MDKTNNLHKYLKNDRTLLSLVLLIGLALGLIYVFIMPPWQHHDEPNHFEHVWLAAHLDKRIGPKDYDPVMSRAVVESMIAHNFYRGMIEPVLGPSEQEVKIPGYSAKEEPPLYYALASLPVKMLSSASIETQLLSARLVSLLLLLVAVIACWGAAQEIFPPGHTLRWLTPLTMVLLPSFVELMTAVNNDAAAIALGSVFIWGSARLVKRGFSLLDVLALTVVGAGCYLAKNTALLVTAIYPFVILFSVFHPKFCLEKLRKWTSLLILAGIVLGAALVMLRDDAAYWHRAVSQLKPLRLERPDAVHGEHALMLETKATVLPSWFPAVFQLLPSETGAELAGKTVTFGFWAWASEPMGVNSPVINTPSQSNSQWIEVNKAPKFFSMQVFMPLDANRTWISIAEKDKKVPDGKLFFDGFVLAEGGFPADQAPTFDSADGSTGEWGGRKFVNLLRNGSIEKPGYRLKPRLDILTSSFFPDNAYPSMLLSLGTDWSGVDIIVRASVNRLMTTFWAVFGWGHIHLSPLSIYRWFWVVSVAGLIGALVGMLRRKGQVNWEMIFIVVLAYLITWGITMTRGFTYAAYSKLYLPVARHAFPSIVPTLLILTWGWFELSNLTQMLWRRISQRIQRLQPVDARLGWYLGYMYVFLFVALDVFSIITIVRYYQ